MKEGKTRAKIKRPGSNPPPAPPKPKPPANTPKHLESEVERISRLYFECHVTIEPVFDDRLVRAGEIARAHRFRIADLLMQKRKEDSPERSKHDTFMTGRDKRYDVLDAQMRGLIAALELEDFVVWRAKIEDTLFDTKYGDKL